jgi:hypothetical protein
MNGPKGDEAFAIFLGKLPDEAVHVFRKAHDFGCHIIDEAGAFDSDGVEVVEEGTGVGKKWLDPFDGRNSIEHHLPDSGLDRVQRFEVNMNVRDARHRAS